MPDPAPPLLLYRVVAPHFVAGVVFQAGRVTRTAPILAWCMGWAPDRLERYLAKRQWRYSVMVDRADA